MSMLDQDEVAYQSVRAKGPSQYQPGPQPGQRSVCGPGIQVFDPFAGVGPRRSPAAWAPVIGADLWPASVLI